MPLTDIEVAVKDNYHVSTHTGHYLIQFYYPMHIYVKRLSNRFCPSGCLVPQHIYWVKQLQYLALTLQSITNNLCVPDRDPQQFNSLLLQLFSLTLWTREAYIYVRACLTLTAGSICICTQHKQAPSAGSYEVK